MNKICKLLFVLLMLQGFSISCLAQDTADKRAQAADRYLHVVPMQKMLDDMFSEMSKQMPPEQRDEIVAKLRAGIRVDMLERIAKDAMIKVFTAEELNALADFYASPNGASAMKKFGAYMSLIMPALQSELQQASLKLQSAAK
jgi:hypothetical protein